MKLGLHDPRPGAIALNFRDYIDYSLFPTPPTNFGHYLRIPPNGWGMLGNDQYGDCAIAGPEHQIMCWNKVAGRTVPFTTDISLTNYSAITGFSLTQPNGQPWPTDPQTGEPDNPTDQGTALDAMAEWWRTTGFLDANNRAHTIEAYVATDPGNLLEHWVATYVFESVTLGFALPDSAIEQAQNRQVWDVVAGSTIVGGHCVPAFGRADGHGVGVSWGAPVAWTDAFFQTYNNQGIVPLNSEMMVRAVSVEGFDDAQLRDDLQQLGMAA